MNFFFIPLLLFAHLSTFSSFGGKRYYVGANFHFFTSDKGFDDKRKLREIEFEYIERRFEVQFKLGIVYGFEMESIIPIIGREINYPGLKIYQIENEIGVEPFIADINAWGLGDMKATLKWSLNMEEVKGGVFLDFKIPTGATKIEKGRVPLGTGQPDIGFYLFGGFFSKFLDASLSFGYISRIYGEPSYILYFPIYGVIGKGVDPGDEINIMLNFALKIKSILSIGIALDFTTTQGDGIKFLKSENDKLEESWGYYDPSRYAFIKPFLSLYTKDGFVSEIEVSFPVLGKNYPSEPLFPFLRNFPLYPSTGISASIGYNF